MGNRCPLPSPMCIPGPLTRCLQEEEDDELSGSPSTGNAAQRSRILLEKPCPPAGWGDRSPGRAFPTQMATHDAPSISCTGNSPESKDLLKLGLNKSGFLS